MPNDIKFADLNGTKSLADGDRIACKPTPDNALPPSQIKIELKLGPDIKWWKGVQSGAIVLCQCQDSQNDASTTVAYSDFSNQTFDLWKAKAFGVHTLMYTVTDALEHMKGGHHYLFEWLQDS
jgi:hypothetical protein